MSLNDQLKNASRRNTPESLDQVQMLIQKGADVNHTDVNGDTALQRAIYSSNLPLIKFYLEQKHMDVNYINKRGISYLMLATKEGHMDVVRYLLEECSQEVDLEHQTPDGRNYMDFIKDEDWEMSEYLTKGAHDDDDVTDLDGFRKRRLREVEREVEYWRREHDKVRMHLEAYEKGTNKSPLGSQQSRDKAASTPSSLPITSSAPEFVPTQPLFPPETKTSLFTRFLQHKVQEAYPRTHSTAIDDLFSHLEKMNSFEEIIAHWRIVTSETKIDNGGYYRHLCNTFTAGMMKPPSMDIAGGRFRLPSDGRDKAREMRCIGKMMMRFLLLDVPLSWHFATIVFSYILGREPYDVHTMMSMVKQFDAPFVDQLEIQLKEASSSQEGRSQIQREVCEKLEAKLYGTDHRESNLDALKEGFFSCVPKDIRRQIEMLSASELQALLLERHASFDKDGTVKRLVENMRYDPSWEKHSETRTWFEEWLTKQASVTHVAQLMIMMSGMRSFTGKENIFVVPSNRFHGHAAHYLMEIDSGCASKEAFVKSLEGVLRDYEMHISHEAVTVGSK
uniref:HECT domain-containing protein n=1 Tax=Percolomonas cosmopolitus TaxID=63605 RepID=A0A7S1KSS5_9EUKA